MVTELRRQAEAEAQIAMRALVAWMVKHPNQRMDPVLGDVYSAAERVVLAVGELEAAQDVARQAADDEAPDRSTLGIPEGELRAMWGDR